MFLWCEFYNSLEGTGHTRVLKEGDAGRSGWDRSFKYSGKAGKDQVRKEECADNNMGLDWMWTVSGGKMKEVFGAAFLFWE